MILAGFLWFGAMLSIWLAIFAAIKYGSPNSLAGRTLLVLT